MPFAAGVTLDAAGDVYVSSSGGGGSGAVAKIAAIGVHIKRWVTTHGFALNVSTDLSYYDWIIACEGEPVTSMERILGREVDMAKVEDRLEINFRDVFGHEVKRVPAASMAGLHI